MNKPLPLAFSEDSVVVMAFISKNEAAKIVSFSLHFAVPLLQPHVSAVKEVPYNESLLQWRLRQKCSVPDFHILY